MPATPWSPSSATRPTARTLSREMAASTSVTYSLSSLTMSYVLPLSATAVSISILSFFTVGGSDARQKKNLKSVANSGGARITSRCRCAHTAYAGSAEPAAASVSSGALRRSNTCWCTSAMSSVTPRNTLTVASTTALLLCCSRSSSAFMMSKVSPLSAGGYSATTSRMVTCDHSVKSLMRLMSPYTFCLVAIASSPSTSRSTIRQLATTAASRSVASMCRRSSKICVSASASGARSCTLSTPSAAVLRGYGCASFSPSWMDPIRYSTSSGTRMDAMLRMARPRMTGLSSRQSFCSVFTVSSARSALASA
mmetsp:Transcript_35310/g.86674  ORF Transcript_35310/g.86674 Transcript_35310/m.86674 type:complete len:310 (+) Transcript_35310:408-1337(+)